MPFSIVAGVAITILIELFTAEGCSSCPPADALLEKLLEQQPADGVVLVGLGEHVDYWDREGWKDRFSAALFTARQRDYVSRGVGAEVFTPQMVVDGRVAFVGSDVNALRAAVERAKSEPHGTIEIHVEPGKDGAIGVSLAIAGVMPSGRADVFLAVTEDHLRTDVQRGENKGRTLTHAAVVRRLESLGDVKEKIRADVHIARDWHRENLHIVAFVQERTSRRVLATAVASPP